jgi:acetyl esterase
MVSVTGRFRGAVNGAGNILGSRALPLIPDSLKRVVVGRRSIMIDENRLDPTLQIMLAARNAMGLRDLTDGDDPIIVRESTARMLAQFDHKPIPVSAVDDLTIPGPHGEIPARHYQPGQNVRAPLMVFYHGGGFMFGSLETHDRLCRLICRGVGIHVLSVAYRLAPEHPAPAAVQDAYAAFRWALAHAGDLGAEPGTVCVGGDSAGGNLAAVVSHQARDEGTPPQLQLLLYPATDMRGATSSRKVFAEGFLLTRKDIGLMERDYLTNSGMEVTDAKISPLLSQNFAGLPPTIVVTAGFDPLRDEGESYAAALAAEGTVVDLRRFGSLVHGFAQLDAIGGGCANAMAEITSAIRAHLCHG